MQGSEISNEWDVGNLIVFDGECVLCSSFFRFMLRHDRAHVFQFATAQSPLGQRLYRQLDLPTQDFETNLVIINQKVHQRLDAFAAAMAQLRGPWRAMSLCRYLPRLIKDPLYHAIARNRYAIFGRTDSCMVPDAEVRSRFATQGF